MLALSLPLHCSTTSKGTYRERHEHVGELGDDTVKGRGVRGGLINDCSKMGR